MQKIDATIPRSLTARVAGLSIFFLIAFTAAAPAVQRAPGIAGQRLAAAAARFESASWPAGPVRAALPPLTISFDGYTGGPVDFNPGAPVIRRFADQQGVECFLVEISVRETAAEARSVLLEYLASISSPGIVPTAASLGISAGDIGFVGRAPEQRISWIVFLRGNVTVRVACLDPRFDPHPEMGRIAEALDRQILDQPLLLADEKTDRILITSLRAAPGCRAGDAVPLELKLTAAPVAVQWVVGGPGQGYVEQDEAGVWRLYTTREGAVDLACHVLGGNGFTASASVTIEVSKE
jgi:hypothetical protein